MAEAPAHQSLYRRYRPQRFAEVRGQDHVIRALQNAVREGRVGHAYLFSGPRGTGKTSTARILAKALNCLDPQDGDACGACESCEEIRLGRSYDVHELDAASNRGIDSIRSLIERAAMAPARTKKVYIVDEVHQLTKEATTALLKTLEEPPEHLVFVLATTDPHKVLATIRSRTQHYEFHLLPADALASLVRDINADAGLELTDADLDVVVRRGGGSARDTLSVLDQAAAAGEIADDTTDVGELVDALCEKDAGRVLVVAGDLVAAGRDPQMLAVQVIDHLRSGFLLVMGAGHLVAAAPEAAKRLEDQARRLGVAGVTRAIELLGTTLVEMREALDKRIALEVALVRLARPEADASPAALLERIERLEQGAPRAAAGGTAVASPAAADESARPSPAGSAPAVPAPPPPPRDVVPARSGAAEARRLLQSAGGGDQRGGRPSPSAAAPSGPPTAPPSSPPPPPGASAGDRPAPPPPPASAAPAAPSSAASFAPASSAPPSSPPAAPPAGSGDVAARPTPTRDELTMAWGDRILDTLGPGVKAMYRVGRFVSVEGTAAVFALPNEPHRVNSERRKADVEAALRDHFKVPLTLRLIVDGSLDTGGGGAPRAADPEPEEVFDRQAIEQMEDAPAGMSAADKVLQAFPGAEEVSNGG